MDVVVTVPMQLWVEWIDEGDLPGDDPCRSPLDLEDHWGFSTSGFRPTIEVGERVYIVAHRLVRGYAPLTRLEVNGRRVTFGRRGGAVAVTIPEPVRGFRGWRYRWWDRVAERPFPDWRNPEATAPRAREGSR